MDDDKRAAAKGAEAGDAVSSKLGEARSQLLAFVLPSDPGLLAQSALYSATRTPCCRWRRWRRPKRPTRWKP